ncbi:MAG: class I SAM-dependent methyltransferase [Reichenbachiella sp.]
MSDFDLIAPIYDGLAQCVFLGRISKSKAAHLSKMEPDSNILVLGGGTGEILEQINKRVNNCTITYVEMSTRMIERAKRRKGTNRVQYLNNDFLKTNLAQQYDYIICNYFLDLFHEQVLDNVLIKVSNLLHLKGQLIVTDFQITRWWHRPFSVVMHQFFRHTANLQSNELNNIQDRLRANGFELVAKQEFYGCFMFSALFESVSSTE